MSALVGLLEEIVSDAVPVRAPVPADHDALRVGWVRVLGTRPCARRTRARGPRETGWELSRYLEAF